MANPKDEFDRQQQALATAGQAKSLAASADPSNASRLAKIPPGIGGNPIVAATAQPAQPAQAQSNPIAQSAMSTQPAAQPARAASPNQTSPSNIYPQSSPAAGANVYGAAGLSGDQFGSSGKFAQVPSSIGQQPGRQQPAAPAAPEAPMAAAAPVQQGMTDAQREQAIGQIPTGGIASPARPAPAATLDSRTPQRATPATQATQATQSGGFGTELADIGRSVKDTLATAFPGTAMAFKGSMDDSRQAYQQSGMGGAIGAAARTAMTPVIGMADDVIGSAGKLLDPAAQALKTFVTGDATPISQQNPVVAAASAAPASASAAAKPAAGTPGAPVAPNPSTAGATTPPQSAANAGPNPADPNATQIAPNVYRSGNSYSDSAAGAVAGAQPVALPSTRNALAADVLAQRSQQESAARVAAAQPQEGGMGFAAPTVAHSGNDWATRQRLKDMETSASSITNRAEWRSGSSTPAGGSRQQQGVNDPDGKIARYNAAVQADLAAQGKVPDAQLKTNEINAGLQRAAMNEQGENYRAAGKNAIAAAELSQRGQEIRSQADLRNLEVQRAQRSAGILQRYDAAKDETERMGIIRQYPDVFGKNSTPPQGKDRYITVGGGTSVVDGQTVREPTMVFDTLNQQYVGGAAPSGGASAAAKQSEYTKDQVYVDPQTGAKRRWNGQGWDKV